MTEADVLYVISGFLLYSILARLSSYRWTHSEVSMADIKEDQDSNPRIKIPFSPDDAAWTKTACARNSPGITALILLTAELTNNEPDAVRLRYEALLSECSRVYYGL
jgi:hypothetical protein